MHGKKRLYCHNAGLPGSPVAWVVNSPKTGFVNVFEITPDDRARWVPCPDTNRRIYGNADAELGPYVPAPVGKTLVVVTQTTLTESVTASLTEVLKSEKAYSRAEPGLFSTFMFSGVLHQNGHTWAAFAEP